MSTRISFEEKRELQVKMLQEIDAFCRAHDIKYSLAFGTLLGAIRHKGFIPWDDDVDIMMPLPDMMRFKELFQSDNLKYCDVETEPHYYYAFSRVADVNSFNKRGLISKTYGICIDLYPVVAIARDKTERDLYFKSAEKQQNKCAYLRKWRSRILRYLPLTALPIFDSLVFDKTIHRFTKHILSSMNYDSANMYYIIAGPVDLREKMTYNFNLFEKMIRVEFEGISFSAIAEYDKFLSLRYGDYMTPPPPELQIPTHGGYYYWK